MALPSKNLPFEYTDRWAQIGDLFVPERLSSELVNKLDKRDKDLEDYLANVPSGGGHIGASVFRDVNQLIDNDVLTQIEHNVLLWQSGTHVVLDYDDTPGSIILQVAVEGVYRLTFWDTFRSLLDYDTDWAYLRVTVPGTGLMQTRVQRHPDTDPGAPQELAHISAVIPIYNLTGGLGGRLYPNALSHRTAADNSLQSKVNGITLEYLGPMEFTP